METRPTDRCDDLVADFLRRLLTGHVGACLRFARDAMGSGRAPSAFLMGVVWRAGEAVGHLFRDGRIDRGTLATGAPGDVTIFSTEREWAYDVNRSLSKSRNSPFDGKTFRGGPVATVVGGRVVWRA